MKAIDAKFSGQGDDFVILGTVQLSDEKRPLPCPFCGETDITLHPDAQSGIMQLICRKCHARGPGIFIIGAGTTATVSMDAILAGSIDFWNTRAFTVAVVDNA